VNSCYFFSLRYQNLSGNTIPVKSPPRIIFLWNLCFIFLKSCCILCGEKSSESVTQILLSFISIICVYVRGMYVIMFMSRCYNKNPRYLIRSPSRKFMVHSWSISAIVVYGRFISRYESFYCYFHEWYGVFTIHQIFTKTLTAFKYLQNNLNLIQNWLKLWRIKVNESTHVTFIMRTVTYSAIYLNGIQKMTSNILLCNR